MYTFAVGWVVFCLSLVNIVTLLFGVGQFWKASKAVIKNSNQTNSFYFGPGLTQTLHIISEKTISSHKINNFIVSASIGDVENEHIDKENIWTLEHIISSNDDNMLRGLYKKEETIWYATACVSNANVLIQGLVALAMGLLCRVFTRVSDVWAFVLAFIIAISLALQLFTLLTWYSKGKIMLRNYFWLTVFEELERVGAKLIFQPTLPSSTHLNCFKIVSTAKKALITDHDVESLRNLASTFHTDAIEHLGKARDNYWLANLAELIIFAFVIIVLSAFSRTDDALIDGCIILILGFWFAAILPNIQGASQLYETSNKMLQAVWTISQANKLYKQGEYNNFKKDQKNDTTRISGAFEFDKSENTKIIQICVSKKKTAKDRLTIELNKPYFMQKKKDK